MHIGLTGNMENVIIAERNVSKTAINKRVTDDIEDGRTQKFVQISGLCCIAKPRSFVW